jgi:hypothetical protein
MVPILYASSIPYNQQEQRIDAPVPAGTAFGGPELAARSGWSSRHRIGVRCRCHLIAGVEVKVLAFVGASTRIPYNSEAIPHLAKDTQP